MSEAARVPVAMPLSPSPESGEGDIIDGEVLSEEDVDIQDQFEERVTRLLGMIAEDASIRDRMLCELYVTISEFSETFREMQSQMEELGPKAFLQMAFGRGGNATSRGIPESE